MSYDGSLRFDTRMDTSGFQKDANKLGNFVKGLGVFEIIKKGLEMIASSIDGAVSRYDTLNRFPKIMEQMGYSADHADKAMNKLSDGIQGLPTTLDDIVTNTRQLVIATGDLDTGVNSALALNNAFLASGATAEEASRGMVQYIQMLSSGKVDMQSWRTLNETMTYALQRTAESFGFAGASAKQDLYAALRDGVITFEEFNARIIQLNDGVGGFAEMAKTATGGIGTAMTNLKTRMVMGVTSIIEVLDRGLSATRFKSIENIINAASTGIKNALMGVAKGAEFVVKHFVPLTAGVIAFSVAVKGVKLLSLIGQMGSVTAAIKAMTPAILASTKAKIVDLAQTAWLTAAYAKDAVVKGLSTVATGLNTTATKLSTAADNGSILAKIGLAAVTAVATAAQWLWNAAMSANPIALVVIAVLALVAAIVALVSWLGNSGAAYKKQKEEVMYGIYSRNRRDLPILPGTPRGFTETLDTEVSWNSVLDAVQKIAEASGLCFTVRFDPETAAETFVVYRGTDRSDDDSDDYVGYFGTDAGNVSKVEMITGSSDYKNVAVVAGEGEGAARVVRIVSLGTFLGEARRELYVDARDLQREASEAVFTGQKDEKGNPIFEYRAKTYTVAEYNALLDARGLEKLSEHLRDFGLSCDIEQTNLIYRRDYFLGDRMPIKLPQYGVKASAVVSSVRRVYEQTGSRVIATLSNFILEAEN